MSNKVEAAIDIIVAIFVMFSAMLDPRVSVILALAGLGAMAVYKFVQPTR